jgi:hypothetical protein
VDESGSIYSSDEEAIISIEIKDETNTYIVSKSKLLARDTQTTKTTAKSGNCLHAKGSR